MAPTRPGVLALIRRVASEVGPYGVALLCVLEAHAGERGQVKASLQQLAEWLGASRSTVIRTAADLERRGLISRHTTTTHTSVWSLLSAALVSQTLDPEERP